MNRDHDSRFKLRSYTVFGYNYVPTSGRSHRALRGRVEVCVVRCMLTGLV